MTHPTKPDRRGPPSLSEEDKARARTLLFGWESIGLDDITAEFARIREEERERATAAERERIALSFERAADMTRAVGGSEVDATADEARAAAIRSRGEGDANEKG